MQNLILLILTLFSPIAISQDRVSQFDFDNDGKVSFEDLNRYCDVSSSLFKRADKNKDGYLSNSEMRTGKRYLFSSCDELKEFSSRTPNSLLEE